MTRREAFCVLLGLACVSGWATRSPCAETNRRPNVIVVLVDDLRWDEIACAGHPFVKTPSIDRIALIMTRIDGDEEADFPAVVRIFLHRLIKKTGQPEMLIQVFFA